MTPFETQVITAIRKRVGKHNKFNVRLDDIAAEVGRTPDDVRIALIELADDGFFPGATACDAITFSGRLPS